MPNFNDVLSQMRNTPMSNNPLADIMDNANLIAKAIVRQQKEQRAEPYVQELQQAGQLYATDPTGANARANTARADLLASGGSPFDLDQKYWGSDPTKGFQTGAGQFRPGYKGDNLTIGQKIAQAPIFGTFEGKPILQRLIQEAGLSGMYGGKPTMEKTNLDRNYGLSSLNSQRDYQTKLDSLAQGWAGLNWDKQKYGIGLEQDASDKFNTVRSEHTQNFYGVVDKYSEPDETTGQPLLSSYNRAWLKQEFNNTFDHYANMTDGYAQFQKDKSKFEKQHPGLLSDIFVPSMEAALRDAQSVKK